MEDGPDASAAGRMNRWIRLNVSICRSGIQAMQPSAKQYFGVALLNLLLVLPFALFAPPTNIDYRGYYIAGKAALFGATTVYDWNAQVRMQSEIFGARSNMPFFHPPAELLILKPLSRLSYSSSLVIWETLNLASVFVAAVLLGLALGMGRWKVIGLTAALAPTVTLIESGQDSGFLLLALAAAFFLLHRERDGAAGVVLALACFKPQIPLVVAAALLLAGKRRFFVAFVASSLAIAAASLAYLGREGASELLRTARVAEHLIPVSKMPTLRGMVARYVGDHFLITTIVTCVVLMAFIPLWRRASLDFTFASATSVACAVSPHLFIYDLVVLAIPIATLSTMHRRRDFAHLVPLTSVPLLLLLLASGHTCLLGLPVIFLSAGCLRLRHPVQATQSSP